MRPPFLSKKELEDYFITQEQWDRIPWFVKCHVVLILFWEVEVKQGMCKLGLKLGGLKVPRSW